MKFNLNINQKSIIESNLDIDIQDACILDFISTFSHSDKIKKLFIGDKVYYWFDYNLVSENLPILKLKKDTVYRRFKYLSEIGLLEPHPDNQNLGRPYYHLSQLLMSLFFTIGFKSDPTEKNPTPYGNESVPPTEKNPNDNSIKYNVNKLYFDIEKKETVSEFEKTFEAFLKMRKEKKVANTEHAVSILRKKVLELSKGLDPIAIEILNQSIIKSWTDLYKLKEDYSQNKTTKNENKPTIPTEQKRFKL